MRLTHTLFLLFIGLGSSFNINSLRAQSLSDSPEPKLGVFTSLKAALKHPRKVVALELKDSLGSLPKQIMKFKNLEVLNLHKCQLAALPEEIWQ